MKNQNITPSACAPAFTALRRGESLRRDKSLVSTTTSANVVPGGFTLGLDLGDRSHHVCVLDATGQIVRESSLSNTRPALAKLLADFPHATVAMIPA